MHIDITSLFSNRVLYVRPEWFKLLKKFNSSSPLKGRNPLKAFQSISNIHSLLSEGWNPFGKRFSELMGDLAKIAKYNQPLHQLLLEMITQPESRVYEEFAETEGGHPSLDWRIEAMAALHLEKVLPSEIWDEYRDQIIEYFRSKDLNYMVRCLLPDNGKRWKDHILISRRCLIEL